jgi:hypothetical protein
MAVGRLDPNSKDIPVDQFDNAFRHMQDRITPFFLLTVGKVGRRFGKFANGNRLILPGPPVIGDVVSAL